MKQGLWQWLKRLFALIEIPAPDPPRLLHRIEITERDIMLPAQGCCDNDYFLFICFHSMVWSGIKHIGHCCRNGSIRFHVVCAGQCSYLPCC